MPYNVMSVLVCVCVCVCECIQYSACVAVVLWCVRIKPSRSKNTYVQGWNSIMPALCANPRHGETQTASERAASPYVKTINIISDL